MSNSGAQMHTAQTGGGGMDCAALVRLAGWRAQAGVAQSRPQVSECSGVGDEGTALPKHCG